MASFFKSAFEKLSSNNQERIATATEYTALQVSPQGDLFGIFVDMRNYLKAISEKKVGSGTTKLKIKGKDAKALGVATQGIGAGMQMIVEAINALPDATVAQEKMDVITSGIDALSEMGLSILKFAGYLALSLPLLILGIPALMLAVPMILAVGGIFWLLGKMGISGEITETSEGLAMAGLAMVALAGGLVLAGMILVAGNSMFGSSDDDKNKDENSMGWGGVIGAVVGMVLGTALVFGIAGKFAPSIFEGASVMLYATLPILLLAASFAIFAMAVTPDGDGWETIAQVTAVVTGLGLLMSAAGAAAVFIIPGAAAMVISGLALISVAAGISLMASVLNPSMFEKGGLFADSGNTTKGVSVLGITLIPGGRPMSNLEWALLSVGRSFMLPPLAIAGMYAGAPALIMAGLALLSVAKGLEAFQALDVDYESLPDNIAKTTTVLAIAFGKVGELYPGGGGSFLQALTGDTTGTSSVHQGISAVGGMGKALAGIAAGVQHMAMLSFPTKWDKNGNPIAFRSITDDDLLAVGTNTKRIINSLTGTFGEIGGDKKAQGSTWFTSSTYEKGIKLVDRMGDPLVKLSTFVKDFATVKKEDIDNVASKTKAIVKGLTGAFMENEDGSQVKPMDMRQAAMAYTQMSRSSGVFAENFIEFKDGINDLDLEKVVEVRKMYEGLAALSKSDSNIVEDMSESMIEAIELLAEKLGEFSSDVKSASSGPSLIDKAKSLVSDTQAKIAAKNAPPGTAAATSTSEADKAMMIDNSALLLAIKKLERTMSSTQNVFVVNQEGSIG